MPEARDPQPNKPPGERSNGARRKAAGVGLLAMKDETGRDSSGAPVAVQLKQDIKPGTGVGTGVGVGVGAGNEAGIPVRAMITSNATRRQRRHQHRGLQPQHRRRRPRRPRDHAGRRRGRRRRWRRRGRRLGAAARATAPATAAAAAARCSAAAAARPSRSIEEIKLVFERNKGAIYAIYNRALREDPSLQGKVVVELKIAPSGEVVDVPHRCRASCKASELERKLLARIRQFDFGAKDVDRWS